MHTVGTGSAFPSEVADVGAAARAVVLVDHAAIHAERDEAAAQVAPDQAEAQAPKPGFGAGTAVALHPRCDQLATVGTHQVDRVLGCNSTKMYGLGTGLGTSSGTTSVLEKSQGISPNSKHN